MRTSLFPAVLLPILVVGACSAPASPSAPEDSAPQPTGIVAYDHQNRPLDWDIIRSDDMLNLADSLDSDPATPISDTERCTDYITLFELINDTKTLAASSVEEACHTLNLGTWGVTDQAGVVDEDGFTAFAPTADLVDNDSGRRITAMTTGQGYAVWQETVGPHSNSGDWRIFAADIDTGDTWLVASARDLWDSVVPPPGLGFAPTVHDGRIQWVVPVPLEDGEAPLDDNGALLPWHSNGGPESPWVPALVSADIVGADLRVDARGVAGVLHLSEGRTTVRSEVVDVLPSSDDAAGGLRPVSTSIAVDTSSTSRPLITAYPERAGRHTLNEGMGTVDGSGDLLAVSAAGDVYLRDAATWTAWKVPAASFTPMLTATDPQVTDIAVEGTRVVWVVAGAPQNQAQADAPHVLALLDVRTRTVSWMPVEHRPIRVDLAGNTLHWTTFDGTTHRQYQASVVT